MRENGLWFERAIKALSADVRRDSEVHRSENRAYFEDMRARTDEILAEGRAGRKALFRILDRMDGNGGAAPAG